MRIQWSSNAAQEILRYMRAAGQGLDAGMSSARGVENALADANPDSDNSVLNRLEDDFRDAVIRLEKLANEFGETIHRMQQAIEIFEDAEHEISTAIERIGTEASGNWMGPGLLSAATAPLAWDASEPRLMPVMHKFDEIPAPTWLQDLLEDPEIFSWISE